MEYIPVKSSNVASIGYDPATEELHVAFKPKKEGDEGRVYSYAGVPYEKYRQFLNAPSVGSHFAAHIRNNYQSHRIDTPKKEESYVQSKEEVKEKPEEI